MTIFEASRAYGGVAYKRKRVASTGFMSTNSINSIACNNYKEPVNIYGNMGPGTTSRFSRPPDILNIHATRGHRLFQCRISTGLRF